MTTGVVFCPIRAWNSPKIDPVVLGRPAYVGRVAEAAGFDLVSATDIVPRVENGKDVPGTIYVLNKKG